MVTIFIFDANHQFVNVRDLSEALYLLASTGLSLGHFHFLSQRVFLSKIFAAFPLLVKKRNTIHNCFFPMLVREAHWKLTK